MKSNCDIFSETKKTVPVFQSLMISCAMSETSLENGLRRKRPSLRFTVPPFHDPYTTG